MPDTGSPYNLPYPAGGESPNGPSQILALANAVATALNGVASTAAANTTNAIAAALVTPNANIATLQAQVTALNALNIGPRLATLDPVDTGWLGAINTNGVGWGTDFNRYRVLFNRIVFLEFDSIRFGGTLAADSQGQISDSHLGTIVSQAWPNIIYYGLYEAGDTSGSLHIQSGTGQIFIRDAHSNSDIDQGDKVRCRAVYLR